MSFAAHRAFGRMAFQSPLLKPLRFATTAPLHSGDLNLFMDQIRTPTWIYQIKYNEHIPNKVPLNYKAMFKNLEHISEFMQMMMQTNRSVVSSVLQRFQTTCGCDSEFACQCTCWHENYEVYELFGDVMRPLPTVSQMMQHLDEDLTGVVYRVGHVPRLDDVLPDLPRFQFEVERMIQHEEGDNSFKFELDLISS